MATTTKSWRTSSPARASDERRRRARGPQRGHRRGHRGDGHLRRDRRRRRGRGRRARVRRVARGDPVRAQPGAAADRRRDRGARRGARADRVREHRQAAGADDQRGDPPGVDQIRFFAGAARMLEGRASAEYMAGHTSSIRREPVGVVAEITPWNYPFMMAIWKFAPAWRRATRSSSSRRRTRRRRRLAGRADAEAPARGRVQRDPRQGRRRRARSSATGRAMVSLTGSVRAARPSPRPRRTRSSACTSSSAARRR